MFALTLLAGCLLAGPDLNRDSFGVPHIREASLEAAFRSAGYAVAEDRLWQMENSRRVARGRMAAVFGKAYVASDKEVLTTGYTDAELQWQFDKLSPESKAMFESYAAGVNDAIGDMAAKGTLPGGYAANSFQPEPWSVLDSVAIAIKLFQTFGQGGAGEIRNFAVLLYLQSRPAKERALDIFDDFLWENDLRSTTTIPYEDTPKYPDGVFPKRTRETLADSVRRLPTLSVLDLLPAIRIAMKDDSNLVAEAVSVPFKVGSYAVVVSPKRSRTGDAILLSAPQMGHRTPAIIHEMSIDCPQYSAVGMDVPGVPGIAIGHSKTGAWGLTSGVNDTTDIYFSNLEGGRYQFGDQWLPIASDERTLNVKGEEAQKVVRKTTRYGPVILEKPAAKVIFSQKSAWWMREMESIEAMRLIASAKNQADVDAALKHATVSFNCFYALADGTIGYRYVGLSPIRAPGYDPRLPLPGEPKAEWKGMIPFGQMPSVANPLNGLLTNWNNKPVTWWPNADTPVWGRTFRVESLRNALPSGKIGPTDVEMAAWWIARLDANHWQIWPSVRAELSRMASEFEKPAPNVRLDGFVVQTLRELLAFDGKALEGSRAAYLFGEYFKALQSELFLSTTGNFMSDSTFRLIAQPSVVLQALDGKTKYDYRGGRTKNQVIRAAFDRMTASLGRDSRTLLSSGKIMVPGEPAVPYSDRGSYIQIVEVPKGRVPLGRNVLPPGVAESGPHSLDQVPMARSWTYKAMGW